MSKKKLVEENEVYILPSANDDMQKFIDKFKIDMMEHVVNSIEYALTNKLEMVELFQFKNSEYVITINKKEFDTNLSHIYDVFKSNQIYESCSKIEKLRKLLNSNEK